MIVSLGVDDNWKLVGGTFPRRTDERADPAEREPQALCEMHREFIRLFA